MLGDLEDKYFNDKDKQEYIQGLEDKLLGGKKSYYLRGEDLFGDVYQGLSFEGRISTYKQTSQWKIIAEFLILMYSTISMFPPKVKKIIKMGVIISGVGLGYITYALSEPEQVDAIYYKQLQQFFFNLNIPSLKMDQFCIFNLVALTKALASSMLMTLLFFSHFTHTSEEQRIISKVSSLYKDKIGFEKNLLEFCKEDLDKVIESKQKKEKTNTKLILVLLLMIFGIIIYSRYEAMTSKIENDYDSDL